MLNKTQDAIGDSLISAFLGKIIESLKSAKLDEAIERYNNLINLHAIKSYDQEKLRLKIANEVILRLYANGLTCIIAYVESSFDFINTLKLQDPTKYIDKIIFLLMNSKDRFGKKCDELIVRCYNTLLQSNSNHDNEAIYILNLAGALCELGRYDEAKLNYKRFFDKHKNKEISSNTSTLSSYREINFLVCCINLNNYDYAEDILKTFRLSKAIDQKEMLNNFEELLKQLLKQKKFETCIILGNILTNSGFTDLQIQSHTIDAYLELWRHQELIIFGEKVINLHINDTSNHALGINLALGISYAILKDNNKSYQSYLKAASIRFICETAIPLFHLSTMVTQEESAGVIKLIAKFRNSKNSEEKQLVHLLQTGYDITHGKVGVEVISFLNNFIKKKEFNTRCLELAVKILGFACLKHKKFEKLKEIYDQYNNSSQYNSTCYMDDYYTDKLSELLIQEKSCEEASNLIESLKTKDPKIYNALCGKAKNYIVYVYYHYQKYKDAFLLLEKEISTRMTALDATQLMHLAQHIDIKNLCTQSEVNNDKNPYLYLTKAFTYINNNNNLFQENIETFKRLSFSGDKLISNEDIEYIAKTFLQLSLSLIYKDKLSRNHLFFIARLIELIDFCESKGIKNEDFYFYKGIFYMFLGANTQAAKAFSEASKIHPKYLVCCSELLGTNIKKEDKKEEKNPVVKAETLESPTTKEKEDEAQEEFIVGEEDIDPKKIHQFFMAQKKELLAKPIKKSFSTEVGVYEYHLKDGVILLSNDEKVKPVYHCSNPKPVCFITIDKNLLKENIVIEHLFYFNAAMDKCRITRRTNQAGISILQGVVGELKHPSIDLRLCFTASNVIWATNPDNPPLCVLSKFGNHESVLRLVSENTNNYLFR